MTPRGSAIHEAYAERIRAERLSQPTTGGCLWCPDFHPTGTLEETRELARAHRKKHHPEARERRHKNRLTPMGMVSKKSLDDNIAGARENGAATWASP